MKMKAKIKLGLQYVTMEVKRKENKRKGSLVAKILMKDRDYYPPYIPTIDNQKICPGR